nr:carbonic anhydrase 9 isoform X5 [Chrysemys picta bellii]XP_042702573.1 carbonic anhydrase 9 isoform X5 [Chrysemys picta bellii]
MQSPINIDTNSTIFSHELQPVVLAGYNLDPSERLSLMNNGHTVVLRLPGSLTIASGYPQEYRAMQLHLHWGSPEGPGSEHTVDGRRYDGEIHVVYYNPSSGSIKEAMRQPGGLAVLAAFLQVGPEDNVHYQPLLEQLHKVQEEGTERTVAGFNIEGLLPTNLSRYYRYSGSLTTPPCYQTVNWTVFNQTVLLSKEQISLLETTLQGDDDKDLQNNFRLTQSLHGRKVLANFQASLSPRRVPLPDDGVPPVTPAPDGATERSTAEAPGSDGSDAPVTPALEDTAGGSTDKAPEEGAGCPPCADSEKQLGFALQTGECSLLGGPGLSPHSLPRGHPASATSTSCPRPHSLPSLGPPSFCYLDLLPQATEPPQPGAIQLRSTPAVALALLACPCSCPVAPQPCSGPLASSSSPPGASLGLSHSPRTRALPPRLCLGPHPPLLSCVCSGGAGRSLRGSLRSHGSGLPHLHLQAAEPE